MCIRDRVSGDEFTVNIDAGNEPSVDPTTQIELNISVDLTMNETGLTIEIPTENIVFNGDGGSTPDPDVPDPDDPGKDQITVTGLGAVSYTHLDVYKRQPLMRVLPLN